MSRLQEEAKSSLTPLILGQTPIVSVKSQITIASWVAMTWMTSEHLDQRGQATSQEDREWLMEKGEPPDDWLVWIGRYQGTRWPEQISSMSNFVGSAKELAAETRPLVNTQVTTFVVGHLVGHTFSSPIVRHAEVSIDGLAPIWPAAPADLDWPGLPILDDDDIDSVADAIPRGLSRMIRGRN